MLEAYFMHSNLKCDIDVLISDINSMRWKKKRFKGPRRLKNECSKNKMAEDTKCLTKSQNW